MNDSSLLIVRQRPVPHPELESLIGELQSGFGLDPYTTRQRLLGPGLVQLVQGERQKLEGLVVVLRRHGYACWRVAPAPPRFAPPRLRSLTVGSEAVDFLCEGERRVRLERGMTVVGVLADLSGELAGQQVKRMLARNAYLGRELASVFTPDEIRANILKGQPVFDCYLLTEQGAVSSAFRVLPGRFNPEGLGGRASLGAARNLEAVVELVGEYAGRFHLYTDFGLSQLPGCLPQPARDDPAVLTSNLNALTRYGWLVASLDEMTGSGAAAGSPGTVLAAGVAGMAAVAGVAVSGDGLAEMAAAIGEAATDRPAAGKTPFKPSPLPPPPERPEPASTRRWTLSGIGTFIGGALLAGVGTTDMMRPLVGQAMRSGLLPAVLAMAFCWGGFACLRLKRFVENTPTSRIRSLAMGLVEVRGRAIRRYALVAPMTQSACVWYRLRKYRRDRNDNWKLSSESDSHHVPFILDDGSGQVAIDPAGATVKAKTAETGSPGECLLIGTAIGSDPGEKWVEELIYEGTTLYVLGYARPARGVGPGLRQRTIEMLRRLKLDPQAQRRYDTNGDGRLDADEWQKACDDTEQLAAAEQLGTQRVPTTDHALLGKPPRGLPFLIAEGQTGTALAGRYGWFGAVLLVLGVAAAAAALTLSLKFFRLF